MYTKENLEPVVKQCKNYAEVLRKLNKKTSGSSHDCLKKAIIRLGIDITHFEQKIYISNNTKKTYSEILIKSDKKADNRQLRRAVLESGKTYQCEICNINEWLNKPITLEIHHIDGDNTNNTINNLQLLCPNCHSQTPNFYHTKLQYFCSCGKPITKRAKQCHKCASIGPRLKTRKCNRPSYEELTNLVWSKPSNQVAKELGVSDKSIEKWCKSLNINKPPRGYWSKKANKI